LHESHSDGTLGDKAEKDVFFGSPDCSKVYKLMLDNGKVVTARIVVISQNSTCAVAEVSDNSPGNFVLKNGPFSMLVAASKKIMLKMKAKTARKTMALALTFRQATLEVPAFLTVSFVGAAKDGDFRSSTGAQSAWMLQTPMTYGQAVQGQEAAKWRDAVDLDVEAIRKNKTSCLTDRLVCRRVIKVTCVYKVNDDL